jgi:hypothetical protein
MWSWCACRWPRHHDPGAGWDDGSGAPGVGMEVVDLVTGFEKRQRPRWGIRPRSPEMFDPFAPVVFVFFPSSWWPRSPRFESAVEGEQSVWIKPRRKEEHEGPGPEPFTPADRIPPPIPPSREGNQGGNPRKCEAWRRPKEGAAPATRSPPLPSCPSLLRGEPQTRTVTATVDGARDRPI